ncbi:MAG: FmdB family zinc ribbon protein [Acidimicrobiia bacterium]
MPTYEYACSRCGERLEVFQSFSDKPLRIHEDCGGSLEKVLHPRGVIFKGSGFYTTDSRSALPRKASPASSKGDGKTKSSSDAKTGSSKKKDSSDGSG